MRIGVNLGRHRGHGGGIGVYARSLVEESFRLFESAEFEDLELVLYGDRSILTDEFLEELSWAPALSCQYTGSWLSSAGAFFKELPNGARARILIRKRSSFLGRKFAFLLDQIFLPFLLLRDRVDLLHSVSNFGLLVSPCPQVVTVHDLYQAFPPEDKAGATNKFYQLLFKLQFRRVEQLVTDIKEVAREVNSKFGFDQASIRVIPLGVDRLFSSVSTSLAEDDDWKLLQETWLAKRGIEAGYCLMFASLDKRKNLLRSIEAWSGLPKEQKEKGIVINLLDRRAEKIVSELLGEDYEEDYVQFIHGVRREELPLLFSAADVVFVPTLAEGFGFPALEALAAGSFVVSGKLEHLLGKGEREGVFICNPEEVEDMKKKLSVALELRDSQRVAESGGASSSKQVPLRAMSETVKETFQVYKQSFMKHSKSFRAR